MVKNIFVLHADIGAAKNIAKNICLLDDAIFFPAESTYSSRLEYLKKELYPRDYHDWFACEYKLKNYTDFGIEMDIGDPRTPGLMPPNPILADILETQHFIIDLMDHDTAVELSTASHTKVFAIAPETMFGLNWQIRAYTMKYGANRMFNFTFRHQTSIEKFKKLYGDNVWVEVNLCNFYDKVRERRRILKRSGLPTIPLEWIIYKENWNKLINALDSHFGINIPKAQALELLDQWMNLHWPTSNTDQWEYNYIFKEQRPLSMTDKLRLCLTVENE